LRRRVLLVSGSVARFAEFGIGPAAAAAAP